MIVRRPKKKPHVHKLSKERQHQLLNDPSAPWVMVAGTRTLDDQEVMDDVIARYTKRIRPFILATGEWRGIGYGRWNYVGADLLAERWASKRRYPYLRFVPDFAAHGSPGAFHVRNRELVRATANRRNGFAILVWDGRSPGTRSVIELCRLYKVKHRVVIY